MNVLQRSRTPAPIRSLAATLLAGCLLLPAVASANLITNGDFESGGITSGGFAVDTPGTYGTWLDVNQWQRVCAGGNCFAQHITTGNDNNLLFQGFSATGLTAGTVLNISFDYAFAAGDVRNLRIYGLTAGGTLSNFAPWTLVNGSLLQTTQLALVNSLTAYSTTFTLTNVYSALVIGFEFSSGASPSALRAVDNVVVTATSVPEPASLVLLGLGVLGAGVARRWKAS